MALTQDQRIEFMRALARTGRETGKFDYIPARFLEDLTNSDPAELCWRYVFNREQQDGFTRLWSERRLDLSVDNVVWTKRAVFSSAPAIVEEAERKLREAGFDVRQQRHVA